MQMKDLSGTLIVSMAIFVAAYFLTLLSENVIIQLMLAVLTSAVLFVSTVYLLKFKEVDYVKSILNK